MRNILTLTSIALFTVATAFTAMAAPDNSGANCSTAGKTWAACVIAQSQTGGE